MPKHNSKAASSNCSSESPPESDKSASTTEAAWSGWIWWEEEQIYYRAKLDFKRKVWLYEYTAGADALSVKAVPEHYSNSDLELKDVYVPGTSVVYDTLESSTTTYNDGNEQPPIVERKQSSEDVEVKEQSQKKEDEHGGRQRTTTSRKQRKSKVQNYERIVAYLEAAQREEKKRLKARRGIYRYE